MTEKHGREAVYYQDMSPSMESDYHRCIKFQCFFCFSDRIRVEYEVTQGSVSVTNEELVLADPNVDFVTKQQTVDLDTGITSVTIEIEILPDDIPEVDEVFIVRLLSVSLVNSPPTTLPPILGKNIYQKFTMLP